MKKLFPVLFLIVSVQASASHIVGGEFQMFHISGNQYRINLVYYFDVINNNFGGVVPEQMEPQITAAIFGNASHTFMRNVVLTFASRIPVNQTNPACGDGTIQTQLVTYSTVVTLPSEEFDDALGYYIVWERCCRNYTITNIYSNTPVGSNDPMASGQTFVLEFPPVTKDGAPFINSSPRFFPTLSDYACVDRKYYADFHALDDDGDSLVYSLATPLSTHQTTAVPQLAPKPFPEVVWRPTYGLHNIMHGEPDLDISGNGFLTVVPKDMGLFAFAVKVEEYRKGAKIGEVRRDFQIFVTDMCPQASAPEILAKTNAETYASEIDIQFTESASDDQRCAVMKMADPDALFAGASERISIRAVPLNFSADVSGILPAATSYELNQSAPVSEFSVCFNRCNPWQLSDFQVGIVAFDPSCSLPLTDTVKVNVHIPVNAPEISAAMPSGVFSEEELDAVFTGTETDDDRCIRVKVTDEDAFIRSQSVSIKAIPIGFTGDISSILPEVATVTLDPTSDFKEFKICFDKCGLLNRTNFQIGIIAVDGCDQLATDTVIVNVHMPASCLPQTITFPAISDKTMGDAPFALNATASSGLPITYVSSNPATISIVAGIAVMNAPGKVFVTATQPGNDQYSAATPVEHSFCVNPIAPELHVGLSDDVAVIISNTEFGNVWYKDGVPLDTVTSVLTFEDENAEYTARIEINGCMSEFSNSILITAAAENDDEHLQIYPNPADNVITIRHRESASQRRIELTDVLGKIILTRYSSEMVDVINIDNLTPGIYFVKIHNTTKVFTTRILKQ